MRVSVLPVPVLAVGFFLVACSADDSAQIANVGPTRSGGAGATGGTSVSTTGGAGSGGGGSTAGAGGSSGGDGGNGGLAGSGMGGTGGSAPTNPLVDSNCVDGKVYAAEVLPLRAKIDDLTTSFTTDPLRRVAWVVQALNRRLPLGGLFVSTATKPSATDPMQATNGEGNCFGVSFDATDTKWTDYVGGFRTVVHECGHMMDLNHDRFMMRLDLEYKCSLSGWSTAPLRTIINGDQFDALGPKGGMLDFQKSVYLKATDTGRWIDLFTEANQYVNTLVTSYAYYDVAHVNNKDDPIAGDASRDHWWWVQRYLYMLRNTPSLKPEYDKIANDACWRQLILADWGRVNRYWTATAQENLVGMWTEEAPKVDKLIQDPRLLAEIDNLRKLDGCK